MTPASRKGTRQKKSRKSPAFDHGYALLIAVNDNNVDYARLPDVLQDIDALHDVLVHPQRCAYPGDHVKVISGKASTRDGIMHGLGWLHDKLQADTGGDVTAVIYYTGHGHVEGGSYYLIPYDVNPNRLRTTCIRAEDFAADIADLQPRRLLVMLDCCHSAGMGVKEAAQFHSASIPAGLFMQGERDVASGEGAKGLEALQQGAGRAVLSSSQADQKSWVRKDRKMSIFTYHVIEALTGHAQPQQGAGEVLVSDVMSHVYRRVPESARQDWNAPQQPDYQVSGNFPVALLLGGKGLEQGQAAPDPLELPLPTSTGGTTYQAKQTGSGAIAQGEDAKAVGQGGVMVGGEVKGSINTGTQTTTTNIYNLTPSSDLADAAATGMITSAEGRKIHQLLNEFFSLNDLEGLCFEMGIDDENLRGQTKTGKARALVQQVEVSGRMDELKRLMRVQRPNLRNQLSAP